MPLRIMFDAAPNETCRLLISGALWKLHRLNEECSIDLLIDLLSQEGRDPRAQITSTQKLLLARAVSPDDAAVNK